MKTPEARARPDDDSPSGIVTLLTDLGIDDPFVGMIKGVVLGRFPGAKLVDLCHSVPARDIRHGAFWLARTHQWFPAGTVHLAIVEPGVPSPPRAIIVRAGHHYFVGPNNGMLSSAAEHAARTIRSSIEIREIDSRRLSLGRPWSRAHQSRDVLAPVAADLASGKLPFGDVGGPIDELVPSPVPEPHKTAEAIEGEVVLVDHFGNLVTNVDARMLEERPNAVTYLEKRAIQPAETYFDVEPGEYLTLINSLGTLEIARRDSDAASSIGAGQGTKVIVR